MGGTEEVGPGKRLASRSVVTDGSRWLAGGWRGHVGGGRALAVGGGGLAGCAVALGVAFLAISSVALSDKPLTGEDLN